MDKNPYLYIQKAVCPERGLYSLGRDFLYSKKSTSTNIPVGTTIHNIETILRRGGQLARAAGTVAKLIAKEGRFAVLRLPSRELRLIPSNCSATIGQVSNFQSNNKLFSKAGSKRWIGRRPEVRGIVMNAVDHPHGGGEGKSSIGRKKPMTPWGHCALGKKTRRIFRYSDTLILRRQRNKKK